MVSDMKKVLLLIITIILLYMTTIYIRSYLWKNQAENYVADSLLEFTNPWSGSQIYHRSSQSLKANSLEKLEDRSRIASLVLGNIVEIQAGPDCRLWQGKSSFLNAERMYATCSAHVRFEKKSVLFNMILVDETNGWWVSYGSWRINDFTVE